MASCGYAAMWLILATALHYGGSIISLTYKSTIHTFNPLRFYLPLIRASLTTPPTFRDISLPFSIYFPRAGLVYEHLWQK